jgi:hypothetical protein
MVGVCGACGYPLEVANSLLGKGLILKDYDRKNSGMDAQPRAKEKGRRVWDASLFQGIWFSVQPPAA